MQSPPKAYIGLHLSPELQQEGLIDEEEALRNADSQNNVRLKIKLANEGGEAAPEKGHTAGFSLEEIVEEKDSGEGEQRFS